MRNVPDELAQIRDVYLDYSTGIPEGAWDNAGDHLELLIAALEVIQAFPDATLALEKRLNDGSQEDHGTTTG